jgi:hypothetical protein
MQRSLNPAAKCGVGHGWSGFGRTSFTIYARRILTNNVGFTGIAVLSLALGVGANCAMFSLADTMLLRCVPDRGSRGVRDLDARCLPAGSPSFAGGSSAGVTPGLTCEQVSDVTSCGYVAFSIARSGVKNELEDWQIRDVAAGLRHAGVARVLSWKC